MTVTAATPPATVSIRGDIWQVRRAWARPHEPGTFVIELSRPGVDDVRAGTWSAQAGARVAEIGQDRALPALAAVAARGTVVSHRGGKRAVVRLRGDGAYVKVVRHSAVAAVARAATAAAPFCGGFRIALPEDDASLPIGAVRFPALQGRTLRALGADRTLREADWEATCADFADAWCRAFPALSAAAKDAARDPGRTHDGVAEGRIVRAAAAGVAQSDPDLAPALAQQASELASRLVEYRGPLVLAHRDLHDAQVLCGEGGYALLDVDTAAFAEPALDLGNLSAEAYLRARQGIWSPARAARLSRHLARAASACGIAADRLQVAQRATWLRIAALHRHRPPFQQRARRLLEEIADGAEVATTT